MYSEKTIIRNLEAFEAEYGWIPRRHSFDEVQEFSALIRRITVIESNSKTSRIDLRGNITEKLKNDIRRFIENEQVLCCLDSAYWESNYAYVCCPYEAPVWMADYTFKPIGEIQPGDEIIGWKLTPLLSNKKLGIRTHSISGRKMQQNRERLAKTKVISVNKRIAPVVKITMESGQVIRCTANHLWSSGENDRGRYPWIEAKVGKHLRKVVDLYPNEPPDIRTAAWLGGMYDGEGCGSQIAQFREHNPKVHARLIEAMQIFEFKQKFQSGKRGKGEDYVGFSDKAVHINGEITGKAKFAAWCKPIRIETLEKKILQTMRAYRDKIISIEPDGEEPVYSMQTETGNYVIWGYASKNCNESGQIKKFQPRLSQKVYCSVIEEFDEQGFPIELLILKGRQLGITTQTALKFIHRLLFVPHTQAIMASVKTKSSELIKRILDTAYDECPWWLKPQRLPKQQFANGSILSIQSGMQATGLGQGWTPTLAHVSELADIQDPKKTIEEGLFRAMHSTPNLFMVLEGTGGGSTGWLAETWRAAKADWHKGEHRLRPVFISWPLCPEIYPPEGWINQHPINNFDPHHEPTKRHVARCEAYIRNTGYLSRVVPGGRNYKMPVEQQWFWQFNYNMACKNHTQKTWTSQMPADDFESLIGEHDSVFEEEILKELEGNIYNINTKTGENERAKPMQAYAILGHDIVDNFYDESMFDWDKPVLQLTWNSYRGQTYEWELVPLMEIDENDERATMDKLLIYEDPFRGNNYSCGIDTADGLGKEDEDRSVISVTKNKYADQFDIQVAEFTTNRLNSAQITAFAAAIGAYYSPACPDSRGMKYAIEQIKGPGDTCQHQLKMMGFNNHHDPRRYDTKKIIEKNNYRQGFFSTAWSVSMLMGRFIEAVNGGWYRPQSKWLLEEIRTLERHNASGRSKMEHRSGQHDDRVRAAAMSYFTVHDMDILAERAQKKYAAPKKNTEVSKGICVTNRIGVGDW